MRILLVTTGNCGTGKSTFISENGLEPYTISPDSIRLLKSAPVLGEDGKMSIDQTYNKEVWKMTMQFVEDRMKNGDLIVVDALHSKESDFNQYKDMAELYRYRVYAIDFRDVGVDVAKKQNSRRPEHKRVPEHVIDRVDSQLRSSKIPKWVNVLDPKTFREFFRYKPHDYSHYKKIHHFGDLHGSLDVLQEYIVGNGGIKSDELYIFVGDYVDRGVQNSSLMKYLVEIMNLPNVIFLEGNHEIHLWRWAKGLSSFSKEFREHTQPELEREGVNKSQIRQFYRKLRQVCFYTYGDNRVLVTHGGLSKIPDNLLQVSTRQMINGVGTYASPIDEIFTKWVDKRESMPDIPPLFYDYQIHGHRNKSELPIEAGKRSFNLEGKIEFGGYLRVVTLSNEGFRSHYIKNYKYNEARFNERKNISEDVLFPENIAFLQELREFVNSESKKGLIKESVYGNISSFNFGKRVFWDKLWNSMTTKARGLFFNTQTGEIVARSYDKFFNIGEREDTTMEALKGNLAFPVDVYLKENGFLGILGYDSQTDQLMICSKSTPLTKGTEGVSGLRNPFPWYFRNLLFKVIDSDDKLMELKMYLKNNNCSFTFEVVDMENDPHIIDYPESKIVLLDVVKRTAKYEKASYSEVTSVASKFGFECKQIVTTCHDWEQFESFCHRQNEINPKIEGFVVEDANGFMTKIKLPYYSFWKWMRSVKENVAKQKDRGIVTIPERISENKRAEDFFYWCKSKTSDFLDYSNIITLRNLFEKDEI